MDSKQITTDRILAFAEHLRRDEKSEVTIRKYTRDVNRLMQFAAGRQICKELVMEYKRWLQECGYAVRSINSMLASVHSFTQYMGWNDCRVKSMKLQREIYCSEEKELTKAEYLRLIEAAHGRPRMELLLETICGTGIRVSELSYFTVEAVHHGQIQVHCKNKTRTIFMPKKLRERLQAYAKRQGIRSGIIFCTKSGKAMDRSNIWADMKRLCKRARVNPSKVFPHNLRKLFARIFYNLDKDIAKLADILGHSSIETTRIYIVSSGWEHRRRIERLGLIT